MNHEEVASKTRGAPLEDQPAGSTMSPPHTWTESDGGKTENEEDSDVRVLFNLVLSMPDGNILSSRILSDTVTQEVRNNRTVSFGNHPKFKTCIF